jgi:hypothetical protein
MPMPRMRVTNAHGFEVNELAKLAAHAREPYTSLTLTSLVIRLQASPRRPSPRSWDVPACQCGGTFVDGTKWAWSRQGS